MVSSTNTRAIFVIAIVTALVAITGLILSSISYTTNTVPVHTPPPACNMSCNTSTTTNSSDVVPSAAVAAAASSGSSGSSSTVTTINCDVLIVGAGAGGLTAGYRLSPILGNRLCIVDERDDIGGKVRSAFYAAGSTSAKPLWSPSHAVQLRSGDSILRCMGQEVGMVTMKRGTTGIYYETFLRGVNTTGYQCYGDSTPSASATCPFGEPYEFFVAPNGGSPSTANTYALPAGLCGSKDWTQCSYIDRIMAGLLLPANIKTISTAEDFKAYVTRIYSADTHAYFTDIIGDYFQGASARVVVEYLVYDNAYPYGHLTVMHGGPQVGLWNRVARLIKRNGTRIDLGTSIKTVSRVAQDSPAFGSGYRIAATSVSSNVRYLAKRVILAFPAGHVASMAGDIVNELQAAPFLQSTNAVRACTWNAFFPSKWWQQNRRQCNYAWCAAAKNFTLTDRGLDYMHWTHLDPSSGDDSLGFVQFMPTPERQQANLLRVFYEEETCAYLEMLSANGNGNASVTREIMRRLNARFGAELGSAGVPNPVFAFFHSESFAYAKILAGATFTPTELVQWAVQPLPGVPLAFASESFNPNDSGWQEGAARSAHSALGGPVFRDLISATTLTQLARCRANVSTNNRFLDAGNKNSGNDVCLLLRNEYHMRDLAGYAYCGGPSDYVWPSLANFLGTTATVSDPSTYALATTVPVYEPISQIQHRRYGSS